MDRRGFITAAGLLSLLPLGRAAAETASSLSTAAAPSEEKTSPKNAFLGGFSVSGHIVQTDLTGCCLIGLPVTERVDPDGTKTCLYRLREEERILNPGNIPILEIGPNQHRVLRWNGMRVIREGNDGT